MYTVTLYFLDGVSVNTGNVMYVTTARYGQGNLRTLVMPCAKLVGLWVKVGL